MDPSAWLLVTLVPIFTAALLLLWRFFHLDDARADEEERAQTANADEPRP